MYLYYCRIEWTYNYLFRPLRVDKVNVSTISNDVCHYLWLSVFCAMHSEHLWRLVTYVILFRMYRQNLDFWSSLDWCILKIPVVKLSKVKQFVKAFPLINALGITFWSWCKIHLLLTWVADIRAVNHIRSDFLAHRWIDPSFCLSKSLYECHIRVYT